MIAAIFFTVFLYNYLFHLYKLNQLQRLELNLPIFYSRYSDQFLSFAFLREKIINLNQESSSLGFSLPAIDDQLSGYSEKFSSIIEEYYH